MSSKYQMWITANGEKEKLRLPVHPEEIEVKMGGKNTSVDIAGLGEITIMQDRPAAVISFSCYFPAARFPGVQVSSLTPPATLAKKIWDWKNSKKPVHFLVTGTGFNMHCTIEDYQCSEEGGDVGTLYYSLTLKEYREVSARQVKVDKPTKKASLPADTNTRTDNRVQPSTYTVKRGDCLWNIAKAHLGSGSRYTEIANLNKDIIKNPNLIYPGQVLKLPA